MTNRLLKRLSSVALLCAAIIGPPGERAQAQNQGQQFSAAQIQAGYRVYASQCATCHGQNGNTVLGVDLPRQQFKTVSSDDDIKNRITNGSATAGMPPFKLEPAE